MEGHLPVPGVGGVQETIATETSTKRDGEREMWPRREGNHRNGVNKVPPENKGNGEEGEELSLNEPVTRHSR